jgi:hypothetical protein
MKNNSRKIVEYEINYSPTNGESTFVVLLDNNRLMEISMWSLYLFLFDQDENLEKYVTSFDEWESATKDLLDLGYDFNKALYNYIQQFTDKQIREFSMLPLFF